MARPVEPPKGGLGVRIAVAALVLLVVWIVFQAVVGFVFSMVRTLLFLALLGVVAWVVIVGPPGRRD